MTEQQAEMEKYLVGTLKKLNEATEKLIENSGYSSEAEKMKVLIELIKEQLKNENAHYTVSQVR